MTVEELRQIFVERDAKYACEQTERDARLDAVVAGLEKNNARLDSVAKGLEKNTLDLEKNNARLDVVAKGLEKNTLDLEKNNARLDVVSEDLREVAEGLKKNNAIVGNLSNKIGTLIESVVAPGIVEKFNEKGFHFDSVSADVKFLKEKERGNLAQIDILLENGKTVIAVETKTDLEVKHVNAHIKRIEKLRQIERFKGKEIYGAMTFAFADKRQIDHALNLGLFVLKQPDVLNVSILDFPKGHSAKAW